jgi:ferrous iron transport protein A
MTSIILTQFTAKGGAIMDRINMRKMATNQSGTISAIKVGGELGRRLRDMGLVPGTSVTVKGRAPLYDPVALRVKGYTLTLRNSEADHIMVEIPKKGL